MTKKIALIATLGMLAIAQPAIAGDCTDVIKLSATTTQVVEDEKTFNQDAAEFCREYSKQQGSANAASGNVGYGGFTLGGASANSKAKSIAEKICKSSDSSQLREDAYRTYVREVSPQAFNSYNHCLNSGVELGVELIGGGEKEASIRVAYNSQTTGTKGGVIVTTHSSIDCSWRGIEASTDTALRLDNGQSRMLSCKREKSDQSGFISILDQESARANAYLSIPWSAYKDGVPVDTMRLYQATIQEFEDLRSSLASSVIAFDAKQCPTGYEEYKPAYGRFLRGIDRSGQNVDPDGERKNGALQEDAFAQHSHSVSDAGQADWDGNGYGGKQRIKHGDGSGPINTTAAGNGSETRPKNAAVLYCRKT